MTVSQVLRDGMTGSDGQQHSDNPLNFMKYSGFYKHHTLYVIVVAIAIKRFFRNMLTLRTGIMFTRNV